MSSTGDFNYDSLICYNQSYIFYSYQIRVIQNVSHLLTVHRAYHSPSGNPPFPTTMNLLLYIGQTLVFSRLVAAISTSVEFSNSTFSVTEWKTCQDYPQLQCRESTVPRFYTTTNVLQGTAEGYLVNLERRLKKGKPSRHVWLFQGG